MGKKRKKPRSRKKRAPEGRRDEAPSELSEAEGESTAPAEDPEEAEGESTAPAEEAEEAEDEPTAPAEEAGEADEGPADPEDEAERVDAVIDLDEPLDDPEARAALIAAAAGLAQATEPEPDPAGTAQREDAERLGDDEEADPHPRPEDHGSPAADVAGEDDDRPLIRKDALTALDQFRREGIATIPGELVLDLGETTSPDERDRLLAAALAHVEMQEAIYRVPLESGTGRRWKGLIAGALFIMALFLAGIPPDFLVPAAPPPLTTAETIRGLRTALLLQAQQIEAFQVREERLPRSLDEVETAFPGIRFVRSSNRLYQLVGYTPDGNAVIYDSSSPEPAFDEVTAPWLRGGDDS